MLSYKQFRDICLSTGKIRKVRMRFLEKLSDYNQQTFMQTLASLNYYCRILLHNDRLLNKLNKLNRNARAIKLLSSICFLYFASFRRRDSIKIFKRYGSIQTVKYLLRVVGMIGLGRGCTKAWRGNRARAARRTTWASPTWSGATRATTAPCTVYAPLYSR